MVRLGLISDTHKHLDPRVERAFEGVDAILHAGDVCASHVLWGLEALGVPVTAVEGNCDRFELPHENLPPVAVVEHGGVRILVVHDRDEAPRAGLGGIGVVVFGHTHVPHVERRGDVLWVNPGSAWKGRRSGVGRTVGLLEIGQDGRIEARIVHLDDLGPEPLGR